MKWAAGVIERAWINLSLLRNAKRLVRERKEYVARCLASERSERAVRTPAGATTRHIRTARFAIGWHRVATRRDIFVEAKRVVIVRISNSLHQQLQDSESWQEFFGKEEGAGTEGVQIQEGLLHTNRELVSRLLQQVHGLR